MTEIEPNSARRIGARMAPIDDLRPHPLNGNVMPEDLRETLQAHTHRTGRYPFIVSTHTFRPFVWYRVALDAVVVAGAHALTGTRGAAGTAATVPRRTSR